MNKEPPTTLHHPIEPLNG